MNFRYSARKRTKQSLADKNNQRTLPADCSHKGSSHEGRSNEGRSHESRSHGSCSLKCRTLQDCTLQSQTSPRSYFPRLYRTHKGRTHESHTHKCHIHKGCIQEGRIHECSTHEGITHEVRNLQRLNLCICQPSQWGTFFHGLKLADLSISMTAGPAEQQYRTGIIRKTRGLVDSGLKF